jgi:predicted SAM-dependent methyltransferase
MSAMKDLARRYASRGLREAIRNVAAEMTINRRHRGGVKNAARYAGARDLKIQLGSGPKGKSGWVNVDLFADADLQLDLREPLPFPDNSATLVYSEHVLEHFIYPREVHHLLREIHRVLAPGGMVKLVVPHAGRALDAYGTKDGRFFAERKVRSYLAQERATPMHIVNYIFRQDGQHKYAYDAETLAQALEICGFVDARERPFDPSIDSEHRRGVNSLYMEATKRRV